MFLRWFPMAHLFSNQTCKKIFEEEIWASISVFHYACFSGTLQFYNKSFAIWEDSKLRKFDLKAICLKYPEMRK